MIERNVFSGASFFKCLAQCGIGSNASGYGKFFIAVPGYRMHGVFYQYIHNRFLEGGCHIRHTDLFPLHLAAVKIIEYRRL